MMPDVFADLSDRLGEKTLPSSFLADDLQKTLYALKKGDAPRSLAARTLGTFQRAHEKATRGETEKVLAEIWDDFSSGFIAGSIMPKGGGGDGTLLSRSVYTEIRELVRLHPFSRRPGTLMSISESGSGPQTRQGLVPIYDRNPTGLHRLLAAWTRRKFANVVSVNFDGLTRKAIRELVTRGDGENKGKDGAAVVLSDPESLRNYYYGASHNDLPIEAVVKVWGDVFHAVCTNTRCPDSGARVPIFRLEDLHHGFDPEKGPTYSKSNRRCQSCGQTRQLQIFFTGYEEKEVRTHALMEEMLRTVAPQIGCVVSVGFSGYWDESLVQFLRQVGRLISYENRATSEEAVSFVCVDTQKNPPLIGNLLAEGIESVHVRSTAEEFASLFDSKGCNQEPINVGSDAKETKNEEFFPGGDLLVDGLWYHPGQAGGISESALEEALPSTYRFLRAETNYLKQMQRLRQIGIKTKISRAMQDSPVGSQKEPSHNRLMHSRGAAHLAALWFRSLSGTAGINSDELNRLCSITVFAAFHHDLGHLPFTHLTEEIFEELHWTVNPWETSFKHDDPVLKEPEETYRDQLDRVIQNYAKELRVSSDTFRHWAECALQGRSGYPWIDGILNSPLDVDKIDYVFRDCIFLNQQLHIPRDDAASWVTQLFNESRVLPSGVVLLEGLAGSHARDFLDERWWLYRRQYFRPGFRAVERLARAVIVQWLIQKVRLKASESLASSPGSPLSDMSSFKGRIARDLLWGELRKAKENHHGEPELLLKMSSELSEPESRGLPRGDLAVKWAERCNAIFKILFTDEDRTDRRGSSPSLLEYLQSETHITCSESLFVPAEHIPKVREIVRHIETMRPYRALIDIAVFPRMLSYPARRRANWGGRPVIGDCFAVSHREPDRWSTSSNKCIPLSESAFAERDKNRLAKVMVVSPFPGDPEVPHALDRFRNECRRIGIRLLSVDPEKLASNPYS